MRTILLALTFIASTHVAANEILPVSRIDLDPSAGGEIGLIYQAWLSPHQEGGEEEETPAIIPTIFTSTAPSIDRNERLSRGHGTLAFTNDFSRAFAHVKIAGVDPEDIVMFHIHCGKPGQLGPIIVDFSLGNDLADVFADNELSVEITNEDIVATANHGHGLVAALTAGCPIAIAVPGNKVLTVAGLAQIALETELYFNLHTKGQTFFGDIRGQLYPVQP